MDTLHMVPIRFADHADRYEELNELQIDVREDFGEYLFCEAFPTILSESEGSYYDIGECVEEMIAQLGGIVTRAEELNDEGVWIEIRG